MYQLIRLLSLRTLLGRQAPELLASFVLAEVFYKFHSFALECTAFLLTWLILDVAADGLTKWSAAAHRLTG